MSPSFNLSFASLRRILTLVAVLLVAGCGSPEDRAQIYYERGMQLLSQQDYVKASIEFKNALQLKKSLVGAWRGLLEVELHGQDFAAIADILRTIAELDPKDADTRVRLGWFAVASGKLDEALNLANAAGDIDDRRADVYALKAMVSLQLNDSRGAVREAQAALAIESNQPEAMIVLAAERLAHRDTEGALRILDTDPVAQPKSIMVQLFKLKVLEEIGDREKLESVLRRLIELYPQELKLRRQLAKLYIDQQRPDDAEKELRAVAAVNPTDFEAGLDVVRFLHAVKGPAAARQELTARIAAGGQMFQYQIALAEFDFAQGNLAGSIESLEKLVKAADTRERSLAAQTKLAEIHLRRKQLDAADALVSNILRTDSRNIDGLALRAAIRMERGQLEDAIADARHALNDRPRSIQLMSLLATAYERSGSIELAEKQYADATKASGFDPAVGLDYVAFLRRRGNDERAGDILSELATRAPNNVAVLSALADDKLNRQDWSGAQQIAEKIRNIGEGRGLADQILGAALLGGGQYNESAKVLESAYAAAGPEALRPMVVLVKALIGAQQFDKASAFLKTVLDANPENAEAYVLLGAVQLQQNATDQALKNFRAAVERQPNNVIGYEALADLFRRQGDDDEALKVIRAGLAHQPGSASLRGALAAVWERKGDYDAAIAEYELLLKQVPGSMVAANNLAILLADRRTDQASFERAYWVASILRKSPVPQFKHTLGWVSYRRGDYRSAISLLEETISALPDVALFRYHLGMSYLAADQAAKATAQLKKALELAANDSDLRTKIQAAQQKAAM